MNKCTLLLIAFFSTALFANDEECSEPVHKCKALGLYEEALEKNEQGKWQSAAKIAKKALMEVANDGKLHYSKKCLSMENEGYMTSVSFANCDASSNYYPNQLAISIKKAHPPKPFVFITFKTNQNAWQVENFNSIRVLLANNVSIKNLGGSEMESVKLLLTDSNDSEMKENISFLEPDKIWSKSLGEQHFTLPFSVKLKEKYRYGIN